MSKLVSYFLDHSRHIYIYVSKLDYARKMMFSDDLTPEKHHCHRFYHHSFNHLITHLITHLPTHTYSNIYTHIRTSTYDIL